METKKVLVILGLAGFLVFSLLAVAGDLEPSGAPGPTMKTLDEVEPRIAIHAVDLPLTITEPGSYYLVEDVNFTDTVNAITVECNDVTIDLMGYTLKGPNSGSYSGVYMNGRSNVEVRNGTVRNFYNGIYERISSGYNHRVINVRVLFNSRHGIFLNSSGNLIKGCTAGNNGDSTADYAYAILTGHGSTMTGNTAYNNGTSSTGSAFGAIYAGYGSTVTGNTAYDNGDSATSNVYGFYTGNSCTVTGNTAYNNGTSATGGEIHGIRAGSGSTVSNNTSYGNGGSGITSSGCTIIGNTVRDNTGYGIDAGDYCLIDQNTAYNNTAGNLNYGTGCVLGTNCAP